MGTLLSLYLFLIIVIQFFNVNQAASANGVCFKTELRIALKSAAYTHGNNSISYTAMTTIHTSKAVSYCCPNYDTMESEPLICQSKCAKPCKNGDCTPEGKCACKGGYALDPEDKYNCLPQCSETCGKGTCNAPCVCDSGWNMTDTGLIANNMTCQPCNKPCVNGTCAAPVTCSCLDGYIKINRNICEPHCSDGCAHGKCVGPEICICNPGWYKINLNDTCEVDTTRFDDCVQWKYMLVAVSILLTLVIIITIIIRHSR